MQGRWTIAMVLFMPTMGWAACSGNVRMGLEKRGFSKTEIEAQCEKTGTKAAPSPAAGNAYAPESGQVFRDCADCPEMVVIPAGSFEMGSNHGGNSDERPVHRVTIAQAFAIGRTEVTQRQWRAVTGGDPPRLDFKGCDDCPVERVNWDDVQGFVTRLIQKTGKPYRLPSEAEWEYACRAGGSHAHCGSDDIDSVAWYGNNSGSKIHVVAGKQANAWGLYDMSGNVSEWVEDCWTKNYQGAPTDGSAWLTGNCNERVFRGEAWDHMKPLSIHATWRGRTVVANRSHSLGFRLVRILY